MTALFTRNFGPLCSTCRIISLKITVHQFSLEVCVTLKNATFALKAPSTTHRKYREGMNEHHDHYKVQGHLQH